MMDMTFEQLELLARVRRSKQDQGKRVKVMSVLILMFIILAGYYAWQIHVNWGKLMNQPGYPELPQLQKLYQENPDYALMIYGDMQSRLAHVSQQAGPAFTAGAIFYLCTLCLILMLVSLIRFRLDDRPKIDLIIALSDRLEALGEMKTAAASDESQKEKE